MRGRRTYALLLACLMAGSLIVAAPRPALAVAPIADAGGPYAVNQGTAIQFDGRGSSDPEAGALTYAWDFGDGATGSGAQPTHVYLTVGGVLTVTLTVTDPEFLTDVDATTIDVNRAPTADPGGSYVGVAGQPLSLNGNGSSDPDDDALDYLWQFGDGATATGIAPTHTYVNGGTYTITLTVTDPGNMSHAAATPAKINQHPVADPDGPYGGNQGQTIAFDGTGSYDPEGGTLTYLWRFGDGATAAGASPTHVYNSGGPFTVTLTVTDDASLTDSQATSATINRPPTAAICGGPHVANQGEPYQFDGTCSSDPDDDQLIFTWEFGDGTTAGGAEPTHIYTGGGPYNVTLTVRDPGNLIDQDAVAVAINHPPTADAGGPYSGNQGDAIHFQGDGNDPDGGTLTFAWQFGDGATATGRNPLHTYAIGGTYTVTLTVLDPGGLSGTDQTSAAINRPPTADAGGPYAANPGMPFQFDGRGSSDPDGDPLFYEWEFGDGSTAAGSRPVHSYQVGGTYTVTLTVRDPGDMHDSDETEASINRVPVADAGGPYAANAGQVIILDGRDSSDPDGDILTYAWDFGDGTTGVGPRPSKQYVAGGLYTVTLTVTDTGGLYDQDGTSADINSPPVAEAGGPYSGNEGWPIAFDGGGSSDPDGDTLTYIWLFGDGTTATGRSPSHTYATGGTYQVTLTVRDPGGLGAVDGTTAVINRTPTADAGGPYRVNAGETMSFDGSGSSDPDGDTLIYLWQFGDGDTGAGVAPEHDYASSGIYTVTLTVTDPGGLYDAGVVTAIVNGPPIADNGGPYAGNMGEPISFDGNGSYDPNGDTITYLWEFGDGATADGVMPVHIYVAGGSYTVTLTVTDPEELTGVSVTTADINSAPTADAGGPYVVNAGEELQFDGTGSSDPEGDPLNYFWNFGDDEHGTGPTPIHVYQNSSAIYTVTLLVVETDPDGLSDYAETTATVNAGPTAHAGGPYAANEGEEIQFDGSGSSDPEGGPLTYYWEFGDGGVASEAMPIHTYAAPAADSLYTVTLTVTDPSNMIDQVVQTVPVNRTPVADAGGEYSGNEGEPLSFDATATIDPDADELVYAWEFGDGSSAEGPLVEHIYVAGADEPFIVTLTVTDPGGLFAVVVTTADINRTPIAAAGGPYGGDANVELIFDGSGSSDPDGDLLTYEWEFGDGTTGTGVAPGHTYIAGGFFTVTLTVRDEESLSEDSGGLASIDVTSVAVNQILVTNPESTDVWSEGSAHVITWELTGEIEDVVAVEFKRGSDAGWTEIGSIAASAEEFDWSPVADVNADEPGSQVRIVRPGTSTHPGDLIGLSDLFILQNRAISISNPAAGEEIFETEELVISWDWVGHVPTVNLHVQIAGGDWEPIPGAQGIVNLGNFNWTVPEVTVDDNEVRIGVRNADPDDDETYATSGYFTILDRHLEIFNPEPGDVWSEAATHQIEWQATGPLGNVMLEYRVGFSGEWVELVRLPATSETYGWVLPAVDDNEMGSRVRISQVHPSTIDPEGDQSADFTIQNRVIELTAPPAGVEISERTETTIAWSSIGFIDNVRLRYRIGGEQDPWVTIAEGIPNDPGHNEYTWVTPDVEMDRSDVQLRIVDTNLAADLTRHDGEPFTLINRTITVIAPTDLTEWCEVDTVTVLWTSSGRVPAVDIDWRPGGGGSWRTVVEDATNSGSFAWTTPDLNATTDDAEIRIRSAEDRAVEGRSPVFTMTDRQLELLRPAAGDSVSEGDGALLRWHSVCLDSVAVWVRLRDTDPEWTSQGIWAATSGQILWPVPGVDATETGVRLRLTDPSDPEQVHYDSEPFTIVNKQLAVLRPTVTDSLSEAQPFTIEWDWEGALDYVDIDFRLQLTDDWQSLATQLANVGVFDWVLPLVEFDHPSAQVRVKDSFTGLSDESEPFGVINRVLTMLSPAAGDSVSEAAMVSISWATRGYVPLVRIEFRPSSDEPWTTVVDGLPNTDSYLWIVPEVTGNLSAAQVRVVDTAASTVVSESLAFTVIDRTLAVVAPAAGEIWSEATTQVISWTWNGRIDSVRVDYRPTGDGEWLPIAGPLENLGTYSWLVAEVTAEHPAAVVRVVDVSAAWVEIESAPFTLENRTLSVTAPAPAPFSAWQLETTRELRWASTGFIELVDLELSRAGVDGEYEALATAIANDGAFTWEVSGPETYDAYFRLRDSSAGHVIGISPHPVGLYDLQPPATCADYNHDGTVDLDEVLRIESIIVGSAIPAAGRVDSVNFDCYADQSIDLNDLLGAVDGMLMGAAAGGGRSAGGRFVDGGAGAPVAVRVGEESAPAAMATAPDGRQLMVPLTVVADQPLAGLLVELQLIGATAEPRFTDPDDGDSPAAGATLAWVPLAADPARLVVTLRAREATVGLTPEQLDGLAVELDPDASGAVTVRVLRAEAYATNLMALPVHIAGEATPVVPLRLSLAQNVPNPFNPTTVISFGLPVAGTARLDVHDVTGRLVRRLLDGNYPAGFHQARWDGRDSRGAQVASGVYLYTLWTGDGRQTRKMTLLH